MIKSIKNIDSVSHTYLGQGLEPNQEYFVEDEKEELRLDNCSELQADILAHKITINGGTVGLSICGVIVRNAKTFCDQLMHDFAAENVSLGITQLGLTSHVRKKLSEVIICLQTASLYDAIAEIKVLNSADFDSTILTGARLLAFRNKIETYLGVTLATSWNQ